MAARCKVLAPSCCTSWGIGKGSTAEHGIAQHAKLVLYTRNWQPEYMVRKLGLVAGLHLVVGYFLGKLEQADL